MLNGIKSTALAFLVIAINSALALHPSLAATRWPTQNVYRFEIVDPIIHTGQDTHVTLRLVRIATKQSITNAVITDSDLRASEPDGNTASEKIDSLASDGKGNYTLKANISAPGEQILDLKAEIPGIGATIDNTLVFQVVQ